MTSKRDWINNNSNKNPTEESPSPDGFIGEDIKQKSIK